MTFRSASLEWLTVGIALCIVIAPIAKATEYPIGTAVEAWGRSDNNQLAGCLLNAAPPTFATKVFSGTCNVPDGTGGSVSVEAYAEGPRRYDPNEESGSRLMLLRAKSVVTTQLRDYPPPTPLPEGYYDVPILTGSAGARYRDYLLLGGVRPSRLEIYFDLQSTRSLSPLLIGDTLGHTFIGLNVQPVVLPPPDDYLYYSAGPPYVFGSLLDVRYVFFPGHFHFDGPAQIINGSMGFSEVPHASLADTRRMTVTLGSDFFVEVDNNAILIEAYLNGWMRAAANFIGDPPDTDVSYESMSNNLLTLAGLRAFDDQGRDITALAISGFASLTAVPEPISWVLVLLGLGCIAFDTRRRRRLGIGHEDPIACDFLSVAGIVRAAALAGEDRRRAETSCGVTPPASGVRLPST